MAAIQVYKTDTFEIQRQKINQIGEAISGFSGGGNDFAAGNLKLGDGTIQDPSLAFTSDPKLGFYKPFPKTLGIVSDNKKVVDFSDKGSAFFKSLNITQNSLLNAEIRLDNKGTGYDAGTYTNVPLLGGTGDDASSSITVIEFVGQITSEGIDYFPGNYVNVALLGGSGQEARCEFFVESLSGGVIFGGSGYTPGAYETISLTDGSGSGAIADILVNPSGQITTVLIRNSGSGYKKDDILSANSSDVGGSGSGFTYTITTDPGLIKDFAFINRGFGYQIDDVLSLRSAITGLSANLTSGSSSVILSSVSGIELNDRVEVVSGSGVLRSNTRVSSINEQTNTITLSSTPTTSGSVILKISPPYGDPSQSFEYTISNIGEITDFSISEGGSGYITNDVLSVDAKDLIQPFTYNVEVQEIQRLEFSTNVSSGTFTIGDYITYNDDEFIIRGVVVSNSITEAIYVDNANIAGNESITYGIAPDEATYNISTAEVLNGFFIGEEDSFETTLFRNLTFTPGNTYIFNYVNFTSEENLFLLTSYPGGIWGRSLIEGITTTLDVNSTSLTVSSTTGIVEGMVISSVSGIGQLISNTKVVSIDGPNTITIDKNPLSSGETTLTFTGVEYTSNVSKTSSSIIIKVTDNTPNLYYYSPLEPNTGGFSSEEAIFTINLENPRTNFGSGFQGTVAEISPINIITANPNDGSIKTESISSNNSNIGQTTATNIIANFIDTQEIVSPVIRSNENISLFTTQFAIDSNVSIGTTISIDKTSGNIQTSGNLRTLGSLIVDDTITINNNIISTASGNNLVLSPAPLRTTKVNATTALVIPVGTNNQRPQTGVVETGAIRYNTTTQQYEGFSNVSGTAAWSSLGGIRDVDGNTYILAESTIGANDNTFYFYNNAQNTLRLTTQYLDFRTTKKIRSENMLAPAYTEWKANTPVTLGQYLRYKNNIYEVIVAGTTAGSANPPIHEVGGQFNNNVFLVWYTTAVDSITFEEVESVQIDPNGTSPLVINNELNLEANVIRTNINDLVFYPALGKKVEVLAQSSFVIPVGNNNQRGSAKVGSIRFNTDILQYEGYDGTNWSSLGGVRDVDGNTYIIPELGAGTNENILYFYNDDNNTLQLSSSGLDFYSTDNITSSQSNFLNINVENVTFNSQAFAIDNSGTSTVLTSNKETIDFNLSTGLTTEKLISFTDTGNIIINNGYSSGLISNIIVLDYQLKDFELSDIKVSTVDIALERGLIDSGSIIVYDPSVHLSGKLSVVVENVTKNERELIEFNVCHKGSDIFYTEYGNIVTSGELISTVFDFTASNEVRATFTLNTINNNSGDTVNIVAIKTFIKK